MLRLRTVVPTERAEAVATTLNGRARRLTATPTTDGAMVLEADIDPRDADAVAALVAAEDHVLYRLDTVAGGGGQAWVEVLSEARNNARPVARYLTLMIAAGAIAAEGVMEDNAILIVGAMAVSPDLLPVCAICVGIVGRRPRLIGRAAVTLIVGLMLVTLVATVLGLLFGEHAHSFGLAAIDSSTVVIALAAGVAGILAFETRASAAVGVAISVTTIPASAFLGVQLAVGRSATGALATLAVNVGALVLAGTVTLAVQRAFNRPD